MLAVLLRIFWVRFILERNYIIHSMLAIHWDGFKFNRSLTSSHIRNVMFAFYLVVFGFNNLLPVITSDIVC